MRFAPWCRRFGTRVPEDELLPRSVVRRLAATGTGTELPLADSHNARRRSSDGPRMNEMNVQMLSPLLYRQIFGRAEVSSPPINPEFVSTLQDELVRHGIDASKPVLLPEVDLNLPTLRGANIEEHFHQIAEEQSGPYRDAIETLADESTTLPRMPSEWSRAPGWTRYDPNTDGKPVSVPFPTDTALVFDVEVCVRAGPAPVMATAVSSTCWYSWTSPLLFGASGPRIAPNRCQLQDLIPLESDAKKPGRDRRRFRQPRIVVGHNVSYDRARVQEQYWLEPTALRFLDTMSLHVCVSGITSYQRAMLKSKKALPAADSGWSEQSSLNNLADVYELYCGERLSKSQRDTFVEGTLDDVQKDFASLMTYCAEDVRATWAVLRRLWPMFHQRFPHPATLAGMLEMGSAYLPVNANWTRYLTESDLAYEDFDIEAKHLLAQRADSACALLHDAAYRKDLWLWDEDWNVQELKLTAARKKTIPKGLPTTGQSSTLADGNSEKVAGEKNNEDDNDEAQWLTQRFAHLYAMAERLPVRRPLLPGYPAWYRNLCSKPDTTDWQPGPYQKLSTGMQIAPKLLSLCWEGYPLHYIRGHGWGFLVPYKYHRDVDSDADERLPLEQLVSACPVVELRQSSASAAESNEAMHHLRRDVEQTISRREYYRKIGPRKDSPTIRYEGAGVWCNLELEGCCFFLQLPHKDGAGRRVGNPLSKDFLAKFSENVLAGDGQAAERVVAIARMLSYWRNNRDRIHGQLVVWLENEELPTTVVEAANDTSPTVFGAILPQVVVCGTLTRRAMEPTWMTASNAQRERIGSELRAMVQAPPGYRIVGADVDSQELWIASVLGDADASGLHGGTPFGWMTLSGTKATGTDMHSVTARAVGISRDHAKVINYARIYGAGQQFAERLLKQFNPTLSEAEARSKASKMFTLTKGRKVYRLRTSWADAHPEYRQNCTPYEALKLARVCNRAVDEMFHRSRWCGGTESAMFNRLEAIASADQPRTPFLGGRLSRALEPGDEGLDEDRFMPTRINWVVQSGAVDFLHLMLVCMRWLMGAERIRFCLSFHDEVRYLVEERYAHHAALAMHVTNLLTRSFCAHRIGFRDLPQSVAFFATVEVDRVLRKEAQHDCRTPSNPHGMSAGYGVPDGESLDIYQTLAKLGPDASDMSRWDWHQMKETTQHKMTKPKRNQRHLKGDSHPR
ncbi:DNA polymerase subunit gamma-1, mitochondrial [Anopheles bellator]|uniref:DNA polymerase subunit gamma-1, mitochondrial n=1 Tax=Anopheles bellator TaxID=139047 RepID=UPI0026490DBC|nr:DNA polymerase subunit gamma-1, mitochondrial [Anopheles bellator]